MQMFLNANVFECKILKINTNSIISILVQCQYIGLNTMNAIKYKPCSLDSLLIVFALFNDVYIVCIVCLKYSVSI